MHCYIFLTLVPHYQDQCIFPPKIRATFLRDANLGQVFLTWLILNLQRAKSIEMKPRNNRHLLLSLLAMCRACLYKHLRTRYVWEEKLRYPERWLPSFLSGWVGTPLPNHSQIMLGENSHCFIINRCRIFWYEPMKGSLF